MKMLKRIIILFYSSVGLLYGQEISISVNKDSMLIGEQIELKIAITGSDPNSFYLPEMDTMGSFEVVEVLQTDTTATSLTRQLLVTNFDSGLYQFGPIPALVVPELGKLDTIYSNAFLIYVNSVPVDTSAAFMPIKPVLKSDFPWKKVIKKLALPVAIALLIIGLIVYLIWRNTRPKETIIPPKSMLDHFVEAKSKLAVLEQKKLWQQGEIKAYYLSLSEILRTYVEGRYRIPAMESTTQEIMDEIKEKEGLTVKLKDVLSQSDLAKYAKFKPDGDTNNRMMKLAKDFVMHTKPKSRQEIEEGDV